MTVYSLYIYDRLIKLLFSFSYLTVEFGLRHCTCVYYHDWYRTKRPKPASKDGLLPAVSRAVSYQASTADGAPPPMSSLSSPRNTLLSSSGIVVAMAEGSAPTMPPPSTSSQSQPPAGSGALAFDEEAKLVYGVMLSLRSMMKKLSKR